MERSGFHSKRAGRHFVQHARVHSPTNFKRHMQTLGTGPGGLPAPESAQIPGIPICGANFVRISSARRCAYPSIGGDPVQGCCVAQCVCGSGRRGICAPQPRMFRPQRGKTQAYWPFLVPPPGPATPVMPTPSVSMAALRMPSASAMAPGG